MKYRDYLCRTCGFNSMEKEGAYKCPKCGSTMEVANHSMYNNDKTTHDRNNTWVVLAFVIGLPFLVILCVILLRSLWGVIPGIILFIILLIMFLPSETKDKAIPLNEHVGHCWNCGAELHEGEYCPKCGNKIK